MSDVRKQVMAQIISVMAEAEARGDNGFAAASQAFPGTPKSVLIEASVEVEDARTEAWWRTPERTIDGEVIRYAIAGPASEPVPAGPRDAEFDASLDALVAEGGR